MGRKNIRPVIQFGLDGRKVAEFTSAADASLKYSFDGLDYSPTCIRQVCSGKQQSAYGFVWKYADDSGTGVV